MKKVLIITYHWPPAGGPGVQRVLKFVRYLPQMGWQPLVLTVKNGEYPVLDKTLAQNIPDEALIYKTDSLEPNQLYKKFIGMKQTEHIPTAVLAEKNHNWKHKIAAWIRLNLFIPDAKRGWQPYAVKEGLKIIQAEKPAVIFSTSPPPTVHLIAQKLAHKSGIKWVADFRDPWTDIHYYEKQKRSILTDRYDRKLELSVLKNADRIVGISRLDIEHDFARKVPVEKCAYIPNGYDESDFSDIQPAGDQFTGFTLMHLGAIGKERIPVNLFKAVKLLLDNGTISTENFRLLFVGKVEAGVFSAAKKEGISSCLEHVPYKPHKEALSLALSASAMLLLITQSEKNVRILPGKTFEYMRTKKPILALGPTQGEVAQVLQKSGAGRVLDYGDTGAIKNQLVDLLDRKTPETDFSETTGYSRENLTRQLSNLFDTITNEK